jgi:hypothetical protein
MGKLPDGNLLTNIYDRSWQRQRPFTATGWTAEQNQIFEYALLISTTNNLTEISRFTKFDMARGDNSSENIATSSLITSISKK